MAIDYSDAKTDRDLERMEDRPWKRTEVSSPRGLIRAEVPLAKTSGRGERGSMVGGGVLN